MSRRKRSKAKKPNEPSSRGKRSNQKTAPANRTVSQGWRGWALLSLLLLAGTAFFYKAVWLDEGDLDEAASLANSSENAFRDIVARDPHNDQAQYNLGLSLQSRGRLDDAIAAYQAAIAENDSDARYHNNLAAAFAMQKKFDLAIEHFQRALSLDPENIEASFNLGNALFANDRIEDAMVQYRKVITLRPEHSRAHNNLAVALKKSGQLEEAYKHRYEAMRLEKIQQGNAN